jgi:large subunit ribosomal protein L18Ae
MTVAGGDMRRFQVVGRHRATDVHPNPEAYRMIIFAPNGVIAKSKFWYYLHQFRKMKKTTGEILDCVELHEKSTTVKNYGIWLRYDSRSGTHNMYREFRDLTINGAVSQLYSEMAGRHRTRPRSIQIIRTAVVEKTSDLQRTNGMQYASGKVKFPLPHRVQMAKRGRSQLSERTFSAVRPTTCYK